MIFVYYCRPYLIIFVPIKRLRVEILLQKQSRRSHRIRGFMIMEYFRIYMKHNMMTCAAITRMNIVRGYTVEYATAGASLLAILLP